MEKQSSKQKFARWTMSVVVILALMVGSFLAGSILAPHAGAASSSREAVADTGPATHESFVTALLSTALQPIPHPTPAPLALDDADAEERLVAGIYEQAAPSVVHIHVVQHVSGTVSSGVDIPQVPGLPDFFNFPDQPQDFYRQGEASGFVWDDQGHVVIPIAY